MNQEQLWSKRYQDAGDQYLFGTQPNVFLARHVDLFQPGSSALLVADGEGRNSVWLAAQGLEVSAMDVSAVAIEKARILALQHQVDVHLVVGDMTAAHWPPVQFHAAFDWVIGIFIQFVGAEGRERQFCAMQQMTRPGGRILLQGYTPKQLDYRTGGPALVENLYTEAMLRTDFSDWDIEELLEYEDDVAEGTGHKGRSALIGLIARKPDA
ncbi:MAG: SAM-dependent methyltransferase [Janthinobacterium sp.]|jgi:SAM-dependent methyltransferase